MGYIFYVRFARALAPTALSRALPVYARLRRRHPTPSRLLSRTSSHIACPPFDSAEREGVQPAAQLRHVQGHDHVRHVLGALRACPGPHSLESVTPRTYQLRRPHWTVPLLAPHGRLSTRQSASAFNQPVSFDTSKVTTMYQMFYVRSARALSPTALSRAPLCIMLASPPPNALTPLGPYLLPYRMPAFFDSAGREGVQPAAQLRHVQGHEHAPDVPGALRAWP